jgi:hypothetical protein
MLRHPDDLPQEFFAEDAPIKFKRRISMTQVTRIRARVLRLRKIKTWRSMLLADTIEAKLLSQMSWTR